MPYPASWVLFDQLFRQLDRGLLTDAEYRSERWHLDLKYGELLHARGLLSAAELTAKRQALWQELQDEDAPVRETRRASSPRNAEEIGRAALVFAYPPTLDPS